ncbi:DHH family phosphoesterase [Photobacterium rosenbergii]|uniref:DHH family phosphoesterase n=1 Tax=Photobacterium rosenbergii TaxID=294936 RepID=A0ABU3ZPV7_9GAMM|nr:DHH family phosphoesterase [Photobacterium rosenbergii]MDV5172124.1 DHH family phosphoesterase [Photobacterium rosenbergii]
MSNHYDIFNGDADGIIALLQLRLAEPKQSTLITGVKRDIKLLKQVEAKAGDSLTVLDISMEKNSEDLQRLLNAGASVFYADHHRAGDIPATELLESHIDLDANTCTSLIVDSLLNGQYHSWAIAAAYGDNLIAVGDKLAAKAGLTLGEASLLKELGTLINYNGYGATVTDLHFAPADLYQKLLPYSSPFAVIEDSQSPYHVLKAGYESDMNHALALEPIADEVVCTAFAMPNEAWSKRISGVFGNELANKSPNKAHIVFTENADGTFTVSLRAPLNNKQGAGDICSQFPTGGGRAAAAGVNALPAEMREAFIKAVNDYYS